MIYRNVLFKLNQAADDEAIQKIMQYVDRIREEITEVRDYQFAANMATTDGGYNWVLLAVFDNVPNMNAYRVNPMHLEFVEFCDNYTDDFIVSFYEVTTS